MRYEFMEFFKWLIYLISFSLVLFLILISYASILIPSKETITETISDSDSHSVHSDYSSKSEENRLNKITKMFTKCNKIITEGIFEFKTNFINLIYGNNKKKERFMKDIYGYEKKLKLIDKGKNKSKSSVKFKENEEFLFFD